MYAATKSTATILGDADSVGPKGGGRAARPNDTTFESGVYSDEPPMIAAYPYAR